MEKSVEYLFFLSFSHTIEACEYVGEQLFASVLLHSRSSRNVLPTGQGSECTE